jgi:hypothetical protein
MSGKNRPSFHLREGRPDPKFQEKPRFFLCQPAIDPSGKRSVIQTGPNKYDIPHGFLNVKYQKFQEFSRKQMWFLRT